MTRTCQSCTWKPSRTFLAVVALVLLALALRIAWMCVVLPLPIPNYEGYYNLARNLVATGDLGSSGHSALRLPVYPSFLALSMLISKSLLWLHLGSVVLSAMLVGLLFVLAMNCGLNKRTCFLAAGLCAINPAFVCFSPVLASEHLFAVLLVAGLLVLMYPRWRPHTKIVTAGSFLGLAALTRGEALFYVPLFAWLAWRNSGSLRRRWVAPVAILGVTFCMLLPWYCRNRILVGPHVGFSSTSAMNFYLAHNNHRYGLDGLQDSPLAGLGEVELSQAAYRLAFQNLREDGIDGLAHTTLIGTKRLLLSPNDYSIGVCIPSLGTQWDAQTPPKQAMIASILKPVMIAFYVLVLSGSIVSLLFVLGRSVQAPTVVLAVIAFNWVGYAVVFWGTPRYRFLSEAMMCVLAGWTAARLTAWAAHAIACRAGRREVTLGEGAVSTRPPLGLSISQGRQP